MSNPLFGKVITAMVTPFAADGSVDYEVAAKLANHLVHNGSDSLVVCGTTGESPTLNWEEEYQLFRVIKDTVGKTAKVIAGTGSNSTYEAIAATEKAAKLGLDGSLQVVPYYNKPPQEGLYQHFAAIASAAPDLPMLLYNIPGRTGCSLAPETISRLAMIDNIVGIKEATGDVDNASRIRKSTPKSFLIYSGEDSLTLPLLSVGGCGVISVASHLVGKQMQEMIEAYLKGNTRAAQEMHLTLYPLLKVLFCTTNPIPIKAALKLQGWQVGGLRLPLWELDAQLQQQLTQVLKELGLI